MAAIAIGQSSSCTYPILDVYTQVNGFLADVASLEFQIFNITNPLLPVQVYPVAVGTRQAVNLAACPIGQRIGIGHYAAAWTVPLSEPAGTHQIRWFVRLTLSSAEQSWAEEFEVLPEVQLSSQLSYAFVADLRAEGVTLTQASDALLLLSIARASRFIDRACGQFFEARARTYHLDGSGTPSLFFDTPIIAVSSVMESGEVIPSTELKVYARANSEELFAPDDRMNSRIEFSSDSGWGGSVVGLSRRYRNRRVWPVGEQNITVTGIFGYTDPDFPSPTGKTPDLIRRACVLMVLADYAPRASASSSSSSSAITVSSSQYILEERTRDQSVKYSDPSSSVGARAASAATAWTSDPEINMILDMYRASPVVRVP